MNHVPYKSGAEVLRDLMGGVLHDLGSRSAFVVHGSDGIDELSTTGPNLVTRVSGAGVGDFQIGEILHGRLGFNRGPGLPEQLAQDHQQQDHDRTECDGRHPTSCPQGRQVSAGHPHHGDDHQAQQQPPGRQRRREVERNAHTLTGLDVLERAGVVCVSYTRWKDEWR